MMRRRRFARLLLVRKDSLSILFDIPERIDSYTKPAGTVLLNDCPFIIITERAGPCRLTAPD
jgi:hypothetical protein